MKRARSTVRAGDARWIAKSSSRYPPALSRINDPPGGIWVRGDLPLDDGIAVVGSRECSPYGRRIAYRLAIDIVRCGFTVVSGLARGIDAAAHRGALDGGGRTVAVLPSGIDCVYPRQNVPLAARIVRAGALLTEFDPRDGVRPGSFHQRNRVIAGLAVAVVVVEAAHKSGAKITANFALQYNREVLAVPGPVGSRTSAGANSLIAEGAAVCTGIDSLLLQLPLDVARRATGRLEAARGTLSVSVHDLDADARAVLEAMPTGESRSVEQLALATALAPGRLLTVLTDIEVRGLIRSLGGQRYERL